MKYTEDDLRENVPNFTMSETAKILEITNASVSAALKRGRMKAILNDQSQKRIPATEITSYAVRTGRDVEEVQNRVEERAGSDIDSDEFFKYLLIGLGIYFLFKK